MIQRIVYALFLAMLLATLGAGSRRVHAQTAEISRAACANLLTNGAMEADNGWAIADGDSPASFVAGGHSGDQALLLAATPAARSSELQTVTAIQKVALPADAPVELSFWYQLNVAETGEVPQTQLALLDEQGELIQVLVADLKPTANWQQVKANLSVFAGQTIQLYFAAIASTGPVNLLIDNVALCDPASRAENRPATSPLPVTVPANDLTLDPAMLVRFKDLQIGQLTLVGPSDTTAINVRLPADWQVGEGAMLQLDVTVAVVNETSDLDLGTPVGAMFDIFLNDTLLRSITLEQLGVQVIAVPLPVELLASRPANSLQRLVVQLRSGPTCLARQHVQVAISDSSLFVLPHTTIPLTPSLAMLPSPLVQRSFVDDQALIVVADNPDAGELQAAMTAAAALGRMSEGRMALDLTTISQLDAAQREANHLIVVGTTSALQQLDPLPAVDADAVQAGDGIVQIIASPWNAARSVLLLTGLDASGVVKAGQAFSSETLPAGSQGNLALIVNVNSPPALQRVDVDRTFGLLGYNAQTIEGSNLQTLRYRFEVPAGEAVSGDAYVNIVFNHAAALDYARSHATVSINGQPIGGLTFSADSTQLSTLRVPVPRSVIRFGQNELAITTQMYLQNGCIAADGHDLWFTVWPDSLLHLPLNPVQNIVGASPSPGDYPAPFTFDATLGDTTLVMPRSEATAWKEAVRIAFDLGRWSQNGIIRLNVHYSDTLTDEIRTGTNLILVGAPANLPLVADLSEHLQIAQPAGTDQEDSFGAAVQYRLAEHDLVGRIEAIASPWNAEKILLAVFGDGPAGLQQASTALLNTELRQQMHGSVAIINGGQMITGAARPEVPGATGGMPVSGSTTPDLNFSAVETQRPGWLLPMIGLTAVLMIAILAYVIIAKFRQRQRQSRL